MMATHQVATRHPSAVWADPEALAGARWDASYYSAANLELDALAARRTHVAPLGRFLVEPRRVMYMKTESFGAPAEDRVPFVSGVDIDEESLDVNWANVRYVHRSMYQKYPKGHLFDGALLIKVKGPNQSAAYIESSVAKALVSGTITFAAVDGIDPHFLALYLTSNYAQAWRTRLRQNITVEFTPWEELKGIPVLVPEPELQSEIGSLVRSASRQRAQASASWASARHLVETALGIDLSAETFSNISAAMVQSPGYDCVATDPAAAWTIPSGVIGAQYFHPRRVRARIMASKRSAMCLKDLAVRHRRRGTSSDFVSLDRIDSNTGVIAASASTTSGSGSQFVESEILFSRLRPYLNKVALARFDGVGSAELLTYEVMNETHPGYVFFILKSGLGMFQVIDVTSGSTHPRVDAEVVDDILVPRLGDELEASIGQCVESAFESWESARRLFDEARALTRSFVEGES